MKKIATISAIALIVAISAIVQACPYDPVTTRAAVRAYSVNSDVKDYSVSSGQEYWYNTNGAMTKDLNRGISEITYNLLNLPLKVDMKNPVAEARNEYTYSAGGKKLKVINRWASSYSSSPVIGSAVNTESLNVTKTTDYIGNFVYENGSLTRILTENGYYENNNYYFYIRNHLGSSAIVADINGNIVQQNHFYPFGQTMAISTGQGAQPYKFTGKELDLENGLNLYDFDARTYDPSVGRFTSVDPLAEKYYSISPYAYCGNNPINAVDPDGRSTWVMANEDGTYRIVGGDLEDDDLNIYVYSIQDGQLVRGESIGVTTSITSFYDSYANEGNGSWLVGSIINPMDQNGDIFLQGLLNDDPSLLGYMKNATGGKKYDFKRTNNTGDIVYDDTQQKEWYRGMPITNSEFVNDDMAPVYTSAKDIGNMAAGYVAAIKGLTWKQARAGFDGLQKLQDKSIKSTEKMSTQNAQYYGFIRGQRRLIINHSKK